MHEPIPNTTSFTVYDRGPDGAPSAGWRVDYSIDGRGMRGPERPLLAGEGDARVLVVGDSYSFGHGVAYDDTFPARLERSLNEGAPSGARYQVLNGAVQGYDASQERARLRQLAPVVSPHAVVVGYTLNDVMHQPFLISQLRTERSPSALAELVLKGLDNRRRSEALVESYRTHYLGAERWRWAEASRELEGMASFCRERGIGFAVALFPELYELQGYPLEEIHQEVASFCRSRGIPLVDLLPAIRPHPAERLWVHPEDHHPNALAHALVASALEPVVRGLVLGERGALRPVPPPAPSDSTPPRTDLSDVRVPRGELELAVRVSDEGSGPLECGLEADGVAVRWTGAAGGRAAWPLALSAGPHAVRVCCRDRGGNEGCSSATVTAEEGAVQDQQTRRAAARDEGPARDWPMEGHDARRTGAGAGGPVGRPALAWSFRAGRGAASLPALAGGRVLVIDDLGCTRALDAATGEAEWSFRVEGFARASAPAVSGGTVYVCYDDLHVHALDAATGRERWRAFTDDAEAQQSPLAAGGAVFVGASNGTLLALDARTGRALWTARTRGSMVSSPAAADGAVYVSSSDARLYALDAATGARLWDAPTGSYLPTSPAVEGGTVYVGSTDGRVYAFGARDGRERWRSQTGGIVRGSPAAADGTVYALSGDRGLYAIDAATGALRWRREMGEDGVASPSLADGVVYAATLDGLVHALDAATGEERWSVGVGSGVWSQVVVGGGSLYAVADDGVLYAFGEGRGSWTPIAAAAAAVALAAALGWRRSRRDVPEERDAQEDQRGPFVPPPRTRARTGGAPRRRPPPPVVACPPEPQRAGDAGVEGVHPLLVVRPPSRRERWARG